MCRDRSFHPECPDQVSVAGARRQAGLKGGRSMPDDTPEQRYAEASANRPREFDRLVETAGSQPAPVQRYRQEGVEIRVRAPQRAQQQPGKHRRVMELASEFERFQSRVYRELVPKWRQCHRDGGSALLAGAAKNTGRRGQRQGLRAALAGMFEPRQIITAAVTYTALGPTASGTAERAAFGHDRTIEVATDPARIPGAGLD